MVQVGTTAFAADAWCHPATVALQGTMLAMDAPQAVMDFTDGYQLTLTVTAGDNVVSEGNAGMCIAGEGTGAVCAMATAAYDDGVMAANSLKAKMAAAGTFKPASENDKAIWVDLPAGASATLAPAGVNNGVAPAPTPEQVENDEVPEAPEGQDLEGGLAKDASFSVTYYQPKPAAAYAGLWRFQAGEMVSGHACGPDADTMNQFKTCMTAALTGAHSLIAGAAVAFGAAALF